MLRQIGTDKAAVTAGMRGRSSGNSSTLATAKAKAVKRDVLLLAATHLLTPLARQGVLIKDHRQTSAISKGSPVVLR